MKINCYVPDRKPPPIVGRPLESGCRMVRDALLEMRNARASYWLSSARGFTYAAILQRLPIDYAARR